MDWLFFFLLFFSPFFSLRFSPLSGGGGVQQATAYTTCIKTRYDGYGTVGTMMTQDGMGT